MSDAPMLYHFTDTARLPFIIRSGELQIGRNKIGGFPDPDFLWATTDFSGDRTSSADQGQFYRSGKVRHVRFTLPACGFMPWHQAPKLHPRWTPSEVARLEAAAMGKSSPSSWWCRASALPLTECLGIETRSYMNKSWVPLTDMEVVDMIDEGGKSYLAMMIRNRVYASRQVEGPFGSVGYQLRAA